MKQLLAFLCLVSIVNAQPVPRDANGNYIIFNEGGVITGPTVCQPNDPRRVLVSPADFTVMNPFYDRRGAPRWKMQAGVIVYVDPADRPGIDPDVARQVLVDYLDAVARVNAATSLGWNSTRPAIFAKLQAWAQEKQQQAVEALRGGQTADDPVPPSKTTVTPQ